jgi:hypothetical protein
MPIEHGDAAPRKDERELCSRIETHLRRLEAARRCTWRKEVQMLHWSHGGDDSRRVIRIDYALELDGVLIGIEAKLAPTKSADLGRHLKQCTDYSHAVFRGHAKIPREWVGKTPWAVFLAVEIGTENDWIAQHWNAARRLMGPFRVGFVANHAYRGLCLTLCDDNIFWSERDGFRGNAQEWNKKIRAGNGAFAMPKTALPA